MPSSRIRICRQAFTNIANTALLILQNGTLQVSRPTLFNDLFDINFAVVGIHRANNFSPETMRRKLTHLRSTSGHGWWCTCPASALSWLLLTQYGNHRNCIL